MNSSFLVLVGLSLISVCSFSQGLADAENLKGKQMVDTATFFNWPMVDLKRHVAITNDGKYVAYSIRNVQASRSVLVVKGVKDNWQITLSGVKDFTFTKDSHSIVFMKTKDSLCILQLGTSDQQDITEVKSFQLFVEGNSEWLVWQGAKSDNELCLLNLVTKGAKTFKNISSYVISNNGRLLVLIKNQNINLVSLNIVDFHLNTEKEIWKGESISDIIFDNKIEQIAFFGKDVIKHQKSIWIIKLANQIAVEILNENSRELPDSMQFASIINFSMDGKKMFLGLNEKQIDNRKTDIQLNVWSYIDPKLQSKQLSEQRIKHPRIAVINLNKSTNVFCLQKDGETVSFLGKNRTDEYVLLNSRKGEQSESYWNRQAKCTTWLVSTDDATRVQLPFTDATILSNGKYVIGYEDDYNRNNLFAYEIGSGILRNITKGIPDFSKQAPYDITLYRKSLRLQLVACMSDETLLIYDDYDIWQVDPSGKKSPINLTNGRNRNLQYRLINSYPVYSKVVDLKELFLGAFNLKTKESGFCKLKLGTQKSVEPLFVGKYVFNVLKDNKNIPIKANDTDLYLISRESTNESPNIFCTSDFINFVQLSKVYPEKKFNWFKSELISFKTSLGFYTQGVLYKPENFDSTKKYPLIIHYYDDELIIMSNQLNKYQNPIASTGGDLDVAWFVTHGYLVLITDIHYKTGKVGQSVYNSVVGAAEFIAKRPYIDKRRIGIQGHSFGGYETNYLITHSNLFAAAVSSSGISNLISSFGSLWGTGAGMQEYYEVRGGRMGIMTPWEKPSIYIKNSPIFYVGRITIPVLMINNKMDMNVPFGQGLEFFTALRRAGKRAWMLEYENSGHGLYGQEYKDYIIRMSQFFDHYLKDIQPPIWMTRGIPASRKGIDDGLRLDYEIKTPTAGLNY